MKKLIVILFAAAAMIYAACSRPHYYGVGNHKPDRQNTRTVTDTAMGGDAMKKDSSMH